MFPCVWWHDDSAAASRSDPGIVSVDFDFLLVTSHRSDPILSTLQDIAYELGRDIQAHIEQILCL